MINFKNIIKVLVMAMFICALSGEVRAQNGVLRPEFQNNSSQGQTTGSWNSNPLNPNNPNGFMSQSMATVQSRQTTTWNSSPLNPNNPDGFIATSRQNNSTNTTSQQEATRVAEEVASTGGGGETSANFCSGDFGIFSSLVMTGTLIFKRLRDLIYVVAGFGIIAVAVGGFFGNLNWKWLGAIVISLVVIASAGEIIVLVTGCEQFGSTLITNTLTNPTETSQAEYQDKYTEQADPGGEIQWNDAYAKAHPETYAGTKAQATSESFDDEFLEGYDITSDEITVTGEKGALDINTQLEINSREIE